jgi:hypothetical protein
MTRHLRPDEFVDALDDRDALTPALVQHLDGCEACRAELSALRLTLTDASSVPPAAPSPLFWDHFSARVQQATAAEPVRESAWRVWWKPAVALAGVAGAIVLAVLLRPGATVDVTAPESTAAIAMPAADVVDPEEDTAWGLVLALASEFDSDVVREAVMPQTGAADAMIERLTDTQRSELARLLQKEIGAN